MSGHASPAARQGGRRPSRLAVTVFLAPFALLFLATYLVPAGYALFKSFFVVEREGPFGSAHDVFGGLDNYTKALRDSDFLRGIGRMVLFGIVQYPLMVVLALALALLLDTRSARLQRLMRLVYFAPYAVPSVVAALMWGFLYSPGLSPFTEGPGGLGLHIDFLGSQAILWSIANVVTWTYCGFNMIVLVTALQTIDRDLYRAARVDGASDWQIVRHIKLPLLRPALVLITVFSIIGILQLFTEPQVLSTLTGSITSDYTPSLAAFNEAGANNYNYAAALSMILAVVTAVLSTVFMRVAWRNR